MFEGLAGECFESKPLARYTSWRVGGPADILYIPSSIDDLSLFLQQTPSESPLFILGLGSNTLIRDGGIPGNTLIFSGSGLNAIDLQEPNILRAEVGVACAKFARTAAKMNLTGMEFLAGVPGTMGGALAMNAGAHGGETWDHVVAIETIDRSGQRHYRAPEAFKVAYRKVESPAGELFVAAHFVHERGTKEAALEKIKSLLDHRKRTQPINLPNGGSVFRNPPGDHAGRLIEACGLKGYCYGHSCVSPKHANFIVHDGKGCAKELEHLIHFVRASVSEKMNVLLTPEVKVVGRCDNIAD
jgi:UDP-N-acetylmuramate dehydrogenase